MNYAMAVSARVEDKLATVTRGEYWSELHEENAYRDALAEVIDDDKGRTWAEGDIRMGDYILIIDSDTRVPSDCFLDAVSEMEASPQVAIIQCKFAPLPFWSYRRRLTGSTSLVWSHECHDVIFRKRHHIFHEPGLHSDSICCGKWRCCPFCRPQCHSTVRSPTNST